jgi:hypothetical protein
MIEWMRLVPNAQVCVYLIVHITKLQLQTTFRKPLYIRHFACIRGVSVFHSFFARQSKQTMTGRMDYWTNGWMDG